MVEPADLRGVEVATPEDRRGVAAGERERRWCKDSEGRDVRGREVFDEAARRWRDSLGWARLSGLLARLKLIIVRRRGGVWSPALGGEGGGESPRPGVVGRDSSSGLEAIGGDPAAEGAGGFDESAGTNGVVSFGKVTGTPREWSTSVVAGGVFTAAKLDILRRTGGRKGSNQSVVVDKQATKGWIFVNESTTTRGLVVRIRLKKREWQRETTIQSRQ